MKRSEYMRQKLSDLPKYFIKQLKLTSKTTKDGYVYIQICKGMCGPPQTVILAQQLIELKGYTGRAALPPDIGNTTGNHYLSLFSSMILA